MALSSSSLHGKTGEGPSGAGGDRFGRSAPRRRPGVEGKGGGGSAGSIPGLTLCRGGAWRPGHGGQQRRVEALAAAALQLRRGGVRRLCGFVEGWGACSAYL